MSFARHIRRKAVNHSSEAAGIEQSTVRSISPSDHPSSVRVRPRRPAVSRDTAEAALQSTRSSNASPSQEADDQDSSLLLDLFRLIVYHNLNIFLLPPGGQWNVRRTYGSGVSFSVDEVRLPVSDMIYEDLKFGFRHFKHGQFVDHTGKLWPMDTKVAFKTANHDTGSNRSKLRELLLELRILSHGPLQRHPNIVHLMSVTWNIKKNVLHNQDSTDLPGIPSIVTELAVLGNLAMFLSSSPCVALSDKLGLCADVLTALEALHACGIVHADVKCENVLVFKADNASATNWQGKVTDFGFSIIDLHDVGADGFLRQPTGFSEPCRPPERDISGRVYAASAKAVDIWCWGMLLWQVLLDGGRYEHEGVAIAPEQMEQFRREGCVARVASKSLTKRFQSQPSYDPGEALFPEVLDILNSALDPNPGQRPTARQLSDRLFQLKLQNSYLLRRGLRIDENLEKVEPLSSLPLFNLPAAYEALTAFPALAPFIVRELERASSLNAHKERQADALTQLALCASVGYGRARNDEEAWRLIQRACQADSFRGKAIAARLWAVRRDEGSNEELATLELWLAQGAETGSLYAFQDLQSLFPNSVDHVSDLYAMSSRCSPGDTEGSEHPLIRACRFGDFARANNLLDACNGTVPRGRYGDTPLHWLASFPENDIEDFAERVVEKGANVHTQTHPPRKAQRTPHFSFEDSNGATALKWAVSRDAKTAVRVLLRLGALPDFIPPTLDGTPLGVTENPLCWAVHFQSVECVEMLCEQYGTKLINQFDVTYKSPFYHAVVPDPFHHIRQLDASGSRHSETRRAWKQERIISTLIKSHSNLQMVPKQSFGCLHLAAIKDVYTLRILLRLPGCRAMISLPDQQGVTPLAYAIQFGQMDCFKELIANGADQSRGNQYYKIHAISFCCTWPTRTTLEMAKELVKRNPKCVNSVEKAGFTPLHRAAANDAVDVATLLLEHGANLIRRSKIGITPLAVSIASRSVLTVELLCQKHRKAKKGLLALSRKNITMSALEFLLTPGAQSDLASQMGFSDDYGCLDVPFSSTSGKIFDILLDASDPRLGARLATRSRQTVPWSGIRLGFLSAIRTANFDIVDAIFNSGHFSIDTQAAVTAALRQFAGHKSHHIASEPDRRRMLQKMQDLRRQEYTAQMNQRTQRRGLGPVWKAYYFMYASLAEEQRVRWVSDQQNYPTETCTIHTLQTIASLRLELHPMFIFPPWLHLTAIWYLAHLTLFIPYWFFLVRAMGDPLAQVPLANKINIVACVLIALLNPTWPKTFTLYSLYYDHYQRDLARRDARLFYLQMAFLLATATVWVFEIWLLVSTTHHFVTFKGPTHAPAWGSSRAALDKHRPIALVYCWFVGVTQVLVIVFWMLGYSQNFRYWTRANELQLLSRRPIVAVGGKTVVQ